MEQLEKLPNSYWEPKVESQNIRGVLDRRGCINSIFVGLEFKRSKKDAMEKTGRIVLQRRTINQIILAGGFADFVYPENWKDVFDTLTQLALMEDNGEAGH